MAYVYLKMCVRRIIIYKTGEFTDEGYVEALNMLKTLNDKEYFTPNTNAMDFDMARNDFFIRKSAMTYMQSIEFGRCEENVLMQAYFRIPAQEERQRKYKSYYRFTGWIMISSKCEHPDVAVEFLKLMTSKPCRKR